LAAVSVLAAGRLAVQVALVAAPVTLMELSLLVRRGKAVLALLVAVAPSLAAAAAAVKAAQVLLVVVAPSQTHRAAQDWPRQYLDHQ